jgi:hypothetical protein
MLTAFAADGLRAGHKMLFLTDDPTPPALARHLTRTLPEAETAQAGDQIRVLPSRASYLPGGAFRPDELLDTLAAEISLSQRQGYRGLRVNSDLTWAGRHVPDGDALADYETRVNALFVGGQVLAVCHYDPCRFDTETWWRLLAAHPSAVTSDAATVLSELRCVRSVDPPGMRIAGEADLANSAALPSLLTTIQTLPGRCHIDASGLRFADARAVDSLVNVARARHPAPTTIVCSPHLGRMLDLLGADTVPGLTVTMKVKP